MKRRSDESEAVFQEVCVWCGAVIRLNDTKPSRRMCQKCFEQMMREHTRPFQKADESHAASEC